MELIPSQTHPKAKNCLRQGYPHPMIEKLIFDNVFRNLHRFSVQFRSRFNSPTCYSEESFANNVFCDDLQLLYCSLNSEL
ncbi:hypothetical protein CEXT_246581 [Caerostris extrusa]|uniref:Uncharacterized protein n=1 Tax=Caerostris extrusa TaxID=172846 RepID=A0AAV4US42_CAEEX|nr:hypothetical protein CEXT_246581 [Caerostris extrusa]